MHISNDPLSLFPHPEGYIGMISPVILAETLAQQSFENSNAKMLIAKNVLNSQALSTSEQIQK
jgi:hypothetical protein